MEKKYYAITKYASILNRLSNRFFDQTMQEYGLGSGQIFFLLRLSEKEGISIQELASTGYYDKGTTTRAVQKLEELHLVKRMTDEHDKRIQRLYLCTEGKMMIPHIREVIQVWEELVLQGLSEEEALLAMQLLKHIANNARSCMDERRRVYHERNNNT